MVDGGRTSVGNTGSQITNTRIPGSGCSSISFSIAEAPRKQVGQVGESIAITRIERGALLKRSLSVEKFPALRLTRAGWLVGLAGEAASLLAGRFGFVGRIRILSGLASQAVQLQAAARQYAAVVVFGGGRGDFDSVSGGGGEPAGGLLMKSTTAILVMGAMAALGAGCSLFSGDHQTPSGQPALVSLNAGNFSTLKDRFNRAPRSVRVIAMLSPT